MLKKIFSVRNKYDKNGVYSKYKEMTIFGINIKLNILNRIFELIEYAVPQNTKLLNENINLTRQLSRKLSMIDNIWQFNNTKVYVPNYPVDFIQQTIVDKNQYYEQDLLESLDDYIPDNAVITDIGSNIGNHTLYWLLSSSKNVQKVYAFEPVKNTFDILSKNIGLNNLQNKAILFNCGLFDKNTNGEIKSYSVDNIGGTHLKEGNGDILLKRLDDIEFNEEKIDFIKIDVEDLELEVLKGGINFLNKYKPVIFIESFEDYYPKVHEFLTENNYECIKKYSLNNYLYKYKAQEIK